MTSSCPTDEDGLAGVTGFGIVQALEAAGMSNPLLRRPYVAPERGSGPWDARADVFSLGVIAHELLTGRRPAPSGEQDGVFAKEMAPEHRVRLRKVLSTALAELRRAALQLGRCADWRARRGRSAFVCGRTERRQSLRPSSKEVDLLPSRGRDVGVLAGSPATSRASEEPVELSAPCRLTSAPAAEFAPTPIAGRRRRCKRTPWLDTALASPAYEVPAGVFDTPAYLAAPPFSGPGQDARLCRGGPAVWRRRVVSGSLGPGSVRPSRRPAEPTACRRQGAGASAAPVRRSFRLPRLAQPEPAPPEAGATESPPP